MSSYIFGEKVPLSVQATEKVAKYRKERETFIQNFTNFCQQKIAEIVLDQARNYGKNAVSVDIESLKSDEQVKSLLANVAHNKVEAKKFNFKKEERDQILVELATYFEEEGFECLTGVNSLRLTWNNPSD